MAVARLAVVVDAAFARCNGDDVFHAFDGGDAGLDFVGDDVGGQVQMDGVAAARVGQGRLNRLGKLRFDVVVGKAENDFDVQAVFFVAHVFHGLFAAQRALRAGDGNGGEGLAVSFCIHFVILSC